MAKTKAALKKNIKQAAPQANGGPLVFKLEEGLPLSRRTFMLEAMRPKLDAMLKQLEPSKRHLVIDLKYKNSLLKYVKDNNEKWVVRTSTNKAKNTVAIWRIK